MEERDLIDFLEFLRPPTILCRLGYEGSDRRKARRYTRRTGIRFRVIRTSPRTYQTDGADLVRVPFEIKVRTAST